MVQRALPVGDITNQDWIGFFGEVAGESPPTTTTTDIYSAVAAQSDDDYIASPGDPSTAIYVTKLNDIAGPEDLEGDWTVKFRAGKPSGITVQLNLTIELRQFYIDEADPGELLGYFSVEDLPDTLTDYEFAITDTTSIVANPTDLYIRAVATI